MEPMRPMGGQVNVSFESLVTGETTSFRMPADATLRATWDEAYIKLGEARRDGDTLQCGGGAEGKSLMDTLELTLRQFREHRICGDDLSEDLDFQIKGASGGA